MRAVWVLLHRYIGLATAIFLLMAGLTGSVLAFNHELDEWLNPTFYEASSEGVQLPPGTLVDRLQGQHPKLQVWYMEYPNEGGHTALLAAVPRNNPITGKPFEGKRLIKPTYQTMGLMVTVASLVSSSMAARLRSLLPK